MNEKALKLKAWAFFYHILAAQEYIAPFRYIAVLYNSLIARIQKYIAPLGISLNCFGDIFRFA